MKAVTVILPLLLTLGCSKSKYDGHGDGEMSVRVEVVVSDSTGAPVDGSSVTFFSRQDEMLLQLIDALRERGELKIPAPPGGLTVVTDEKGKAVLSCRFDAAFFFRDRPGNVVKSEWRPSGLLRVESSGFNRTVLRLADVFPSAPYTGEAAPHSISIKLEKEGQPAS